MKLWIALFLTTLSSFALTSPLAGQMMPAPETAIEGTWLGSLDVGAMKLRLAFHVKKAGAGLTATLDSIDQGAKDIPVSSVSLDGDRVVLEAAVIGGKYQGKMAADGESMDGSWFQRGAQFPLLLKRVKDTEALTPKRPQNPVKPYPYREEEVTFENRAAGITLAGTVTLPQGKGPFTAVVLITGSGPQNRDEELLGHKPFLVLADYLTRKGLAVLRVDDRGTAKSGGVFSGATTADFATDVEAALAYLKGRADVGAVGLIGHSEGGIIAPMVAARNPQVAFIVLLAGSGVAGSELIPEQIRQLDLAAGMSADKALQAAARERKILALLSSDKNKEALHKALHDELLETLPEPQIEATIAAITSPWFRYFLAYDPIPALKQVKCPVLALNGDLDRQVPPEQNATAIRKALIESGNPHFEVVEMPGLNHLFQTAKTGGVDEYAIIEETMSPRALEKIAGWIEKNAPKK